MKLYHVVSVVLLVFHYGCGSNGPELGTVTGTVVLDGEPLAQADVLFQPESGRPSQGITDENGRYELAYTMRRKGALPGEHDVYISSIPLEPGEIPSPGAKPSIPARYNKNSELTATVDAGNNKIDFDLTSDSP